MCYSCLHNMNAYLLIRRSSEFSAKITVSRRLQLKNALSPIIFTVFGIITSTRLDPLNHEGPICSTFSGTVIVRRFSHLSNTYFPIFLSETGRVTSSIFVPLRHASGSMSNLFDSTILYISEQSLNAALPIFITLSGTRNSVKPLSQKPY